MMNNRFRRLIPVAFSLFSFSMLSIAGGVSPISINLQSSPSIDLLPNQTATAYYSVSSIAPTPVSMVSLAGIPQGVTQVTTGDVVPCAFTPTICGAPPFTVAASNACCLVLSLDGSRMTKGPQTITPILSNGHSNWNATTPLIVNVSDTPVLSGILYAAATDGINNSVWSSPDGLSWSQVATPSSPAQVGISALTAIPPDTNTLYVGTDLPQYSQTYGLAWTPTTNPDTSAGSYVTALTYVPSTNGMIENNMLFAATTIPGFPSGYDPYLWVSTDNGTQWAPAIVPASGSGNYITSMSAASVTGGGQIIAALAAGTIYAETYKSDGIDHWYSTTNPTPVSTEDTSYQTEGVYLIPNSSHADLYAVSTGNNTGSIYVSQFIIPNIAGWQSSVKITGTTGSLANAIYVDPSTSPASIYVATSPNSDGSTAPQAIYYSADNGANWTRLLTPSGLTVTALTTLPVLSSLSITPSPQTATQILTVSGIPINGSTSLTYIVKNTGTFTATNVTATAPTWSGVTLTETGCASLPAGQTCTVTLTSNGTTPNLAGTFAVSADNVLPAYSPNVAFEMKGGLVFSVDTTVTPHVAKVVTETNNRFLIPWQNGSPQDTSALSLYNGAYYLPGTTTPDVQGNTYRILEVQGETYSSYAAGLCYEYSGDSAPHQWYLPAICELGTYNSATWGADAGCVSGTPNIESNLYNLGFVSNLTGSDDNIYWSSTQSDLFLAWFEGFPPNDNPSQDSFYKSNPSRARCVRAFTYVS